jgi:anti-sigma regulatory factor (Ser/Thr protein kinase)
MASTTSPRRFRAFLVWLAAVFSLGFLLFWYRYLEMLASRGSDSFLKPLINEMTGALTGGVLFFAVRWLVRGHPLQAGTWLRRLPLYFLALLGGAAFGTTMMWGLRSLLYPLAGLGAFDYGVMPLRYAMELPMQVVGFTIMVAALHAVDAFRRAREREVHTAQLEASLARAELRNLRLQLQPHFLFNALNTISSTMFRDPAAADEMLGQLAELLRVSLRTAQSDEVPLEAELTTLDCYLGIMRARFGARLRVRIDVEAGTREALVPSMILQPLVENAIRHGNAEGAGEGAVALRASKRGQDLVVEVEDDGPGSPPGRSVQGSGTGLSATAERLRLLYGDAQRFEAGNMPAGGFRVTAVMPFHTAAHGEAACAS